MPDLRTLLYSISQGLVKTFMFFFFFNDTATTEIYTFPYTTLFRSRRTIARPRKFPTIAGRRPRLSGTSDRKSTRLNSSHSQISYAVFCLKKKNKGHTFIVQLTYCFLYSLLLHCDILVVLLIALDPQ